jgi:hypothetical protein
LTYTTASVYLIELLPDLLSGYGLTEPEQRDKGETKCLTRV